MTYSETAEHGVVCVTGASGFTGSTAVDYLLLNGYSVLATDHPDCGFEAVREHQKFMDANPDFYRGVTLKIVPADLTKPAELASMFQSGRVRYLLHPAAVFSMSAPKKLLQAVNVDGTRNLLDAAAAHAPELLGSAVWSTALVYDVPKRPGPITEDDPVNPNNLYVESKLDEENVALEYEKGGMPLVILRTASVYGPRSSYGIFKTLKTLSWSFLLPALPVPGLGRRAVHFAHIDDVVASALHLVYVMAHQNISGRAFNVADNTPMSMMDAMKIAAEALRVKPPVFKMPEKALKTIAEFVPYGKTVPFFMLEREDVPYFFRDMMFDTTQLMKTGYCMKYPETSLGLDATLDWYARNDKMEKIWYMMHPGWRKYWNNLRPENRPFADYKLLIDRSSNYSCI
ncbi:MAG: NAD(P)-dependent oxidoreductase [bacterium]